MARAMKLAVEAGREAFLAGRMPRKLYAASPSSPTVGPDRLMRARARRAPRCAVAARALPAAGAVPLPADEIAKLCADAEGPAHCGRLVEAQQLKRLPGLAVRDGDTLRDRALPVGQRDVRRRRHAHRRHALTRCGTT